jgi:hypothetical protein
MAHGTGTVEGFGRVSRRAGTVFRYVLLASTLVGILALGILLVFVAIDAFRPTTADPGWHLTFLTTSVVPTLAVGLYLRYRTDGGFGVGLAALGMPVVGVLFGAGVAIVFVDLVPPLVWLAYLLAVAVPVALVVAIDRFVGLPYLVEVVASLVLLATSVVVLPGFVTSLRVVPTPGIILAATLGLPAALLVGRFVSDRWHGRRAGCVRHWTLMWIALSDPIPPSQTIFPGRNMIQTRRHSSWRTPAASAPCWRSTPPPARAIRRSIWKRSAGRCAISSCTAFPMMIFPGCCSGMRATSRSGVRSCGGCKNTYPPWPRAAHSRRRTWR